MEATRTGGARISMRPGWPSPVLDASRFGRWPLTSRETEVLAAMADGKSNAAVGEFLFISRKAVEKHVNSIFSKLLLDARDERHPRVAAVLMYLEHVKATSRPQTVARPPRAAVHQGGARGLATGPRCRS